MDNSITLKRKTIVYNPRHGFGICLGFIGHKVHLKFSAEKDFNELLAESLVPVPQDFIDEIDKGEFINEFQPQTLDRGLTYARRNHVLHLDFDKTNNILLAMVQGNGRNPYSVAIRHNSKGRRRFTMECTCPVRTNCKHAAAALFEFQDVIETLKEAVPEESLSEDGQINDLVIYTMSTHSVDLYRLKECIPLLRKEAHLNSFFQFLTAHTDIRSRQEDIQNIIYHAMTDEGVCSLALRMMPSLSSNIIKQMIQSADNTIQRIRSFYEAYKFSDDCRLMRVRYYLNGDYDRCITSCIRSLEETPPHPPKELYDNWIEPISSIPGSYKANEKTQKRIIQMMLQPKTESHTVFQRFCDDSSLRELYLNPQYTGPIQENYILHQKPKDILQLTKSRRISNTLLDYVISKPDDFIQEDPKGTARILELGYYNVYRRGDKDKILNAVIQMPNNSYLSDFFFSDPSDYYYYSSNTFRRKAGSFEIEKKDMELYFTPSYTFSIWDNGNGYNLCYQLKSPADRTVFQAYFLDDSHFAVTSNAFSRTDKQAILDYLKESVHRIYGKQIQEWTDDFNKKLDEKRKAEKYAELKNAALALAERQKALLLGQKEQFSLQMLLEQNYQDRFTLRLQFIQPKKYGVPDLYRFFSRFENAEKADYGKSISLVHLISNFDTSSQAVIEQLLNVYELSEYPSKKNMILPPRLCACLLQSMMSKEFEFNGEKYMLTEDSPQVQVSISKEMKLFIQLKDGSIAPWDFVYMGDKILALDNKTQTAFFIAVEKEFLELFRFASRYEGLDLTPVTDIIRQEVMPYYNRQIKLDDEVKDVFPKSTLSIESYFDFDDKILKHKEKLLLDGTEITPEELSKTEDILCYNGYRSLIEKMGFENGESKEDGQILNFLRMDFTEMKNFAQVFLSDAILNKRLQNFSRKTVQVQNSGNVMEAFMKPSEYTEEELEKIYRALRKKKKYTILSDNRIVALDNEDAAEFVRVIDDLNLDPKKLYEQKQLSLGQSLRALAHQTSCDVDGYLQNMVTDIQNFKNHKMDIPKLEMPLRPYQEEGLRWLHVLSRYQIGGILADDMGLGKTLEIIALIASDKAKKPSLIVCPKSLIFNWKSEFEKFYPGIDVYEVYGNADRRQTVLKNMKKNSRSVYITAYDSLRGDIGFYEKITFNYIIADEAQAFKNSETLKSHNIKKLKGLYRFALTGTPIENSIADLWSIFDFIIPGYFPPLEQFQREYSGDENASQILAKQIGPFLLRRTKELVLKDLPEKYERIVSAEMTKEQRKVYDAYVHEARTRLEEGSKAFDMLPFITRLRQICVDPDMFVENYDGGSGKLIVLEEILREYLSQGHRILLFSQFTKALERVEAMLKRLGISYYILTGDTPAEKRIEYANAFNAGGSTNVFLVSLKAGGTGLNLVGADTIIHLDPWWNVAAENQATDRAHRIGQTRNVEVIRLVCEDTIEQRVIELQNTKKDIIDKVIAKDDSSVTAARLEDIAFILR